LVVQVVKIRFLIMVNLFKTKQVKISIDENPEKYQEVIDESEYGICVTDEKGIFVAVNDNYTKIYGYTKEELIGNHFSMVVHEDNKPLLSSLHDDFIESQTEISRTWEVKGKAGNTIKINVDARFTDKINDAPHKLTFIEVAVDA